MTAGGAVDGAQATAASGALDLKAIGKDAVRRELGISHLGSIPAADLPQAPEVRMDYGTGSMESSVSRRGSQIRQAKRGVA
jgi:hypothetical protein